MSESCQICVHCKDLFKHITDAKAMIHWCCWITGQARACQDTWVTWSDCYTAGRPRSAYHIDTIKHSLSAQVSFHKTHIRCLVLKNCNRLCLAYSNIYFSPRVSGFPLSRGPELSCWVRSFIPGTSFGPSGVMGPGIFLMSLAGSCMHKEPRIILVSWKRCACYCPSSNW